MELDDDAKRVTDHTGTFRESYMWKKGDDAFLCTLSVALYRSVHPRTPDAARCTWSSFDDIINNIKETGYET